ncbi:MAG TPA: DUF3179 domain-containing (seleno)protein, partial [Armatimonadota bacterium]|nr:DUF3179 domain-containing (seleno)protein [Armatimonadota bacterium]
PLFPTKFTPLAPGDEGITLASVDIGEILKTDLDASQLAPIDDPESVPASSSAAPADDEPVIGVVIDGKPRAYPLALLSGHWVVNDHVDGRSVTVLYDPIAGAAAACWSSIDDEPVTIAATEFFYRGNAVFVELAAGCFLLAPTGRFITGELAGRALNTLPYRRESWADWKKRYPETRVVAANAPDTDPFEHVEDAIRATPELVGNITEDPLGWVVGYEDEDGSLETKTVTGPDDENARILLPGGSFARQVVCRSFAWRQLISEVKKTP